MKLTDDTRFEFLKEVDNGRTRCSSWYHLGLFQPGQFSHCVMVRGAKFGFIGDVGHRGGVE